MSGSTRHRFFAESIAADAVELAPAEVHHTLHVLRLADGAAVEVFDGAGAVGEGLLRVVGRGRASVEVQQRRRADVRPGPSIELAFAVPKGKRLDWLLTKATELGAAVLAPVAFARSVARPALTGKARDRWRATCIAAAKQCGADFLPEIRPPEELGEYLQRGGPGLFGEPDAAKSIPAAWAELAGQDRVRILVGPEGGLTDAERTDVEAAGLIPVRLGGYVLRVETAALALLAAVRAIGA